MNRTIALGGRKVGRGHPCFVIAEAGVNHNGSPEIAGDLIDAAASAGADAIKFQTFRTDEIVLKNAEKAGYQIETTGNGESQYQMLRGLELPPSAFADLKSHAEGRGLLFLSSPFDTGSVELLEDLGISAYKVASGEITNIPLLKKIAALGKPVILSTGMAYLSEVEEALSVLRKGGSEEIVLLHAVSSYPAEASDVNLRAMGTLREVFQVPVGFSDHTLGIWAPVAAVSMGASVIEKHLTLDRAMKGPDHRASLEPDRFREMVEAIRLTEASLGNGIKRPTAGELEIRRIAMKSIVAAVEIPAGAIVEPSMLTAKRPGTGIPPTYTDQLAGRKAARRIPKDTIIGWDMVE